MHSMKRVEKLFYRIPISMLRDDVKYDSFVLSSDKDLQVLIHCCRQFPEVRTPELLAKLMDVVCSSRGSNHNCQSSGHPACSSSIPVSASSAMPVIVPKLVRLDPWGRLDCDARYSYYGPDFRRGWSAGWSHDDDDDDDDDDVEPAILADVSDDDIPQTTPVVGGGTSSSGTNQYSRTS
ncbi:hypothetical protein Ahy_A05g023066 [Arachis hypogaea]|uniref:Uncharacterized protein n=1 Tax=Arachis hypogaea TaxID=3818 RepID=A0A445D2A3_ARAHY|nr:hypothetical protein Ahy_A05g023066 [Arachis hypogaea]